MQIENDAGGGTLSGTKLVATTLGVATFSNLSIDKVGTGYTLRATSGALAPAISTGFSITPATATRLAFGVQPSDAIAGVPLSPAVTVIV